MNSVIQTMFDLMTYYGSGNDCISERCFEKSVDFLGLSLTDSEYTRFRRYAFHYLKSIGYIDVLGSGSQWATAPSVLVNIENRRWILLADSKKRAASQKLNREFPHKEKLSKSDPLDERYSVKLYPSVLEFDLEDDAAEWLAKELDVKTSKQYQETIFLNLPKLESVIEAMLMPLAHGDIFEPESTKKFDWTTGSWEPYREYRPYQSGLYRSELKYALPKYFIACGEESEVIAFQIRDRDWALIVSCHALNIKIPLQYDMKLSAITVPRTGFEELRLPTLLERAFRSGTLLSPDVGQTTFTYQGIPCSELYQLVSKIPVFEVVLR